MKRKPTLALIDIVGLPYDGSTLQKRGLGGSESCVIQMSRELTKLGFEVTVFNACNEEDASPGWYDGVEYVPLTEVKNNTRLFDIVISSRTGYPFLRPGMKLAENVNYMYLGENWDRVVDNAKWRMIWMHDTFCQGDHLLEELVVDGYIDELIVLSDWHASYILNCHHGKRRNFEVLKNHIYVARNCMTRYIDGDVDISKKDPNLYVYNASVSKGMEPLLEDCWPKIKASLPDAKLKVVGGYYRFREEHGPDEQEIKWRRLKAEHDGKNGVTFTGIIRQDEIAHLLAKATYFLYPTSFPETFGISTLEAQAYNCTPITCRFGALEEVAMDEGSWKIDYSVTPNVLFPEIDQAAQVEKFVAKTIEAARNPYLQQQKMYHCNAIREIATWDTMAIQLKQHLYRKLGWYLPIEEHRRARWISDRVHKLFKRKHSNDEEWVGLRAPVEREIVVISPFYNAASWLEDHVRSVAGQDYTNYRHILINDASTDESEAVIEQTLNELGQEVSDRVILITNEENRGAVRNQIETIRNCVDNPEAVVVLLDGDDALVNDPNVFHHVNAWHDEGAEFTYGSCWSMADSIPLVAQPYPKEVRDRKAYRSHRFNWGIPYTHLRTFRRRLLDGVDDAAFKDESGEWYRAGGDVATFYELIEQADPDRVRAVADVLVRYNDVNPLNDYKVNADEQNRTAAKARAGKMTREETRVMTGEENKKILIAIPTAKYIESQTFKALFDLVIPEGYEADFQYFYGYNIEQVRNLIVDYTLRNGYDYLFSVDSDIVMPNDTLEKMVAHDKDMVTGLYIQRIPNTHTVEVYCVTEGSGRTHIPYEMLKGRGLVEVAGCGFGCVLVKRRVLERLKYPHFVYRSALDHRQTYSEDVYFCKQATDAGFTIWADTSILCDHVGATVFKV